MSDDTMLDEHRTVMTADYCTLSTEGIELLKFGGLTLAREYFLPP
jgi:hypothetical protein